jgi:F0F1-type ATP synthase assembly protein I
MSLSRIARATLAGIVAGLIVGLLLFLADKYLGWTVSWGFWGLVVGVLVGIIAYAQNTGPRISA